MNTDDGFYEDDEPVEDVRVAFQRSDRDVVTRRPGGIALADVSRVTFDRIGMASGPVRSGSAARVTISR